MDLKSIIDCREDFCDLARWQEMTDLLDERDIRRILREYLKNEEGWYKNLDFNTDHLPAIQRITIEKNMGSCINGKDRIVVKAELDRISRAAKVEIVKNENAIDHISTKLKCGESEELFRYYLEHKLFKCEMEKLHARGINGGFDAPKYDVTVTWFKDDAVRIERFKDYETEIFDTIISEITRKITESIVLIQDLI